MKALSQSPILFAAFFFLVAGIPSFSESTNKASSIRKYNNKLHLYDFSAPKADAYSGKQKDNVRPKTRKRMESIKPAKPQLPLHSGPMPAAPMIPDQPVEKDRKHNNWILPPVAEDLQPYAEKMRGNTSGENWLAESIAMQRAAAAAELEREDFEERDEDQALEPGFAEEAYSGEHGEGGFLRRMDLKGARDQGSIQSLSQNEFSSRINLESPEDPNLSEVFDTPASADLFNPGAFSRPPSGIEEPGFEPEPLLPITESILSAYKQSSPLNGLNDRQALPNESRFSRPVRPDGWAGRNTLGESATKQNLLRDPLARESGAGKAQAGRLGFLGKESAGKKALPSIGAIDRPDNRTKNVLIPTPKPDRLLIPARALESLDYSSSPGKRKP